MRGLIFNSFFVLSFLFPCRLLKSSVSKACVDDSESAIGQSVQEEVEHSGLVNELKDSGSSYSGSISSGICGEGAGSVTSVGSVVGSLTVECTGDSGVESSVVIIDSMSGVEEREVPREPSVSDRVERAPSPVGSNLYGGSGESSAHEFMRMFQGMMAGLMRASDSRG